MLVARLSISLALVIAMLTFTSAAAGGSPEQQLREAAASGNVAQVTALLGQGASVDARDVQGRTALLVATHNNRVQAARVLIDAGADVRLLVKAGADVNLADCDGVTPLQHARQRGYTQIEQILSAAGAR